MDKEKKPDAPLMWWSCPECGKNLFMVAPDAKISGMQIKCRGCRRLINVSL